MELVHVEAAGGVVSLVLVFQLAVIALVQGVGDHGEYLVLIDLYGIRALDDGEYLLVQIQVVGLVGKRVVHVVHAAFDLTLNIVLVELHGLGGEIGAGEHAPEIFEKAGEHVAVAAVFVCGPGGILRRFERARFFGIDGDLGARRQDDGDFRVLPAALVVAAYGIGGLGLGHAAHIGAAHGHARKNSVGTLHGDAACGGAGAEHGQHYGDYNDRLLAAGLFAPRSFGHVIAVLRRFSARCRRLWRLCGVLVPDCLEYHGL